ncbi:hypothetical protein N781_13955 [Pontibacillus halophilus JSM 076056 = DSM 19796]|uniref:Methyltransferase type 11 domain-containing protein n=1 Tax=Pontibacillus halophilus JSM 076056 = DSM 19796 TaxID=1385510 RepID=A0A0A5IB54_9BACI|nr:class I SAM-dependent methyltransferase [Pontibacillus halophilus]KGX93057.1 hypothetical protein N781_13955 [Pontibacillus halophilus JSM 076056 = DSM 19796]
MSSTHYGITKGNASMDILLHHLEERGISLSGSTVLDLACRDGTFTRHLSQLCQSVIGVDATTERIIERTPSTPHTRYIRGLAEHLPCERNSFDYVFAWNCWGSFDRHKVLSEMDRVLKPSGRLIIMERQLPVQTTDAFPFHWYEEWKSASFNLQHEWSCSTKPTEQLHVVILKR